MVASKSRRSLFVVTLVHASQNWAIHGQNRDAQFWGRDCSRVSNFLLRVHIMMKQDELIGLLRGFCVGDKVMVQPGKMREYHGIYGEIIATSSPVTIDDIYITEPRYRTRCDDSRGWAYSDEFTLNTILSPISNPRSKVRPY